MTVYVVVKLSGGAFDINAKVVSGYVKAKSKAAAIKGVRDEHPRMFGCFIAVERSQLKDCLY